MSHLALFYLPTLYKPLTGSGYQFWSGIAGATAVFSGMLTGVLLYWKHVECHVEAPRSCHRRGHPVPGAPYRACHEHNPASQHEAGEKITAEHIHAAHVAGKRIGHPAPSK